MLSSKHFVYSEFMSHDGVVYPSEWIDSRLQPLCDALDVIRDAWGGPIHVVSGYRSPAYNALLRSKSDGVAANSQHPQGLAADIAPIPADKLNVRRFVAFVEKMIADGKLPGVGGFGRYPSWAHVDIREKINGHVARWDGQGFGSEPT
jgi:uncharacterized protein YcbK (DUF882 family)